MNLHQQSNNVQVEIISATVAAEIKAEADKSIRMKLLQQVDLEFEEGSLPACLCPAKTGPLSDTQLHRLGFDIPYTECSQHN